MRLPARVRARESNSVYNVRSPRLLASWLPVALTAVVLLQSVVGHAALRPAAMVLTLVWLAVVYPATRATERAFVAAVLASTAAVVAMGADWRALLGTGLDRATTFVALLASLGLLRDVRATG